jgi:NAD(P)-dependent dehydrogenase (short-subunit alcohol dehydrogenase family)
VDAGKHSDASIGLMMAIDVHRVPPDEERLLDLRGKRVVVTGGAGGIGNAAVRLFCRLGADVGCTFHSTRPDVPGRVSLRSCDVSNADDVRATFAAFAEEFGGLDALVHAAGVHESCPADGLTVGTWEAIFASNVTSTLLTNQAAFEHMRSRGGAIVNMGSCEAVRGRAGSAAYASTRGAVMAWSRSIALEWGPFGVRVNSVAPVDETAIAKRERAALDDRGRAAMDAALQQVIPLGGKMGDPLRDLAPVLAFLISDAAAFITGQTISVDGGLMMLGS